MLRSLQENEIMLFEEIPFYANEAEKKQHNNAIVLLCEELSKSDEVIRPIYEEILWEMKKQARIREYLSILVCRTIRDLARGYEDSSFFRLDDSHVKHFKSNIHLVLNIDSAVME